MKTRLPSLLGMILFVTLISEISTPDVEGATKSPFMHEFADVKFLDAYFGTSDEKIEVGPGDTNVPFTVILANVGTQDITGIRGQLGLPMQFSASDGPGALMYGDADSNSLAGENFALTFFVSVNERVPLQQYAGTVKVDYSRLRESGTRTSFFDFDFKLTGDSIINMRAVNPFLTSLQENHVVIEISNDGTAPVSDVELELQNTQTSISSTSTSITNVENVVILDSNWEVGYIGPGESKLLEFIIYVPESLKGESLRTPMLVSYFNAHGDTHTINRIVDFYVQGLIDLTVYNVEARNIADRQLIIGEIINEGNADALFGFVTLSPLKDSNIKEFKQFIDEIETDSPIPFNIPVEFDGQPRYGEHDVKITVRYKDSLRDEQFLTYETVVNLVDPQLNQEQPDQTGLLILPVIFGIGIFFYMRMRKRKQAEKI